MLEGIVTESLSISFSIKQAIPKVSSYNIHWYYSSNMSIGIDDFNASQLQDITNMTNRTTLSRLFFTDDILTLNITHLVQAIGNKTETDQGRYFMRVSNPAGVAINFTDVIIAGELKCGN